MVKCEEGYFCDVCGGDVELFCESEFYLCYVIGMIDLEIFYMSFEWYVCCNLILV